MYSHITQALNATNRKDIGAHLILTKYMRLDLKPLHFWIAILLLCFFKLYLVSDLGLEVLVAPGDDELYVRRAHALLHGEALGPYHNFLFGKLPGQSLLLASIRSLGIPYLLAINVLYLLAVAYVCAALLRCGYRKLSVLLVFACLWMNPVTLNQLWFRPLREPLSLSLLVLLFGSMVWVLEDLRNKKISFRHPLLLAISLSISLQLREEDKLLYVLYAGFVALCFGFGWRMRHLRRAQGALLISVALPLTGAITSEFLLRSFVNHHYGAPILHEIGEGEFPRMIASIRSVVTRRDNRMVMIPQEALDRLSANVPSSRPMIEKLSKPSPSHPSCLQYKICEEIANLWMLFAIKEAASSAGLTPTLGESQKYFRRVRLDIESACQRGLLTCKKSGDGLFPPFDLKWTRDFVAMWRRWVGNLYIPPLKIAVPNTAATADQELANIYREVTMVSEIPSTQEKDRWKIFPPEVYASLKYYLDHPEIAIHPTLGISNPKAIRRLVPYMARQPRDLAGKSGNPPPGGAMDSTRVSIRQKIFSWSRSAGTWLEIAGILALVVRLFVIRVPLNPVLLIGLLFLAVQWVRFAAFTYLAVYLHFLETRFFFSSYTLFLLIAAIFLLDLSHQIWSSRFGKVRHYA